MPEKELRSVGPGAGSLDRMMSNASSRSASTDSSYDFLSAEEKACLRFLEETIGSLDTETDGGLSTEESEPVLTPRGPRALLVPESTPQGCPEESAPQPGPQPRALTPPSSLRPPAPPGLGLWSGSHSLPRNIHIGTSQHLRPGTLQHPILRSSEGLVQAPGKEWNQQRCESGQSPARSQVAAPALNTELTPPPEAFRDRLPVGPREQHFKPDTTLGPPQGGQPTHEAMSQTAREKGQPQLLGVSYPRDSRDAPGPAGGHAEVQQAPLTAPKPRKLPPNIVLKSSRGSLRCDPQNRLSHSSEASGDMSLIPSSLQEQRRARREALEKLGLPQDHEEPAAHPSKPKPSSIRKVTEPSVQTPTVGPFPVRAPGLAPGQARTPAQEPTTGTALATRSKPVPVPKAPEASSCPALPRWESGLTLQESGTPGLRQVSFKASTLERSGVGLSSHLTREEKPCPHASTSLGKDSFLDKLSPQVLRNSRPRPASLGTGRDFAGIQVGRLADLEQERRAQGSLHQGQSRDKLPRPLCVSVKISPKGAPNEDRREALKKLGLLKE